MEELNQTKRVRSSFNNLKCVNVAFIRTMWAIATSFAAGLATLSIYVKGAPHLS